MTVNVQNDTVENKSDVLKQLLSSTIETLNPLPLDLHMLIPVPVLILTSSLSLTHTMTLSEMIV